jgi:hypothetical protein
MSKSESISNASSRSSQSIVLAASVGIGGATENGALNFRLGVLTNTAFASEADERRPNVESLRFGILPAEVLGVCDFAGGRRADVGVFTVVQLVVWAR